MTVLTLHIEFQTGGFEQTRYNGLQQFSYFITVFVAAPISTLTDLMQGPPSRTG